MNLFDYWQSRVVAAVSAIVGTATVTLLFVFSYSLPEQSDLFFQWLPPAVAVVFVLRVGTGSFLLIRDLQSVIQRHEITKKFNQFDILNAVHETLIRAKKPDLVILDIPVIVLTANELTPEDREQMSGQVKKFMQKASYSIHDLLYEIKRVVG